MNPRHRLLFSDTWTKMSRAKQVHKKKIWRNTRQKWKSSIYSFYVRKKKCSLFYHNRRPVLIIDDRCWTIIWLHLMFSSRGYGPREFAALETASKGKGYFCSVSLSGIKIGARGIFRLEVPPFYSSKKIEFPYKKSLFWRLCCRFFPRMGFPVSTTNCMKMYEWNLPGGQGGVNRIFSKMKSWPLDR